MKKQFVLAALAAAALLAGCGASDSGAGADGHSPRLLAGKPVAAGVSAVNSTNSSFTALSTLRVGQTAYFQVQGSRLPSTLASASTFCGSSFSADIAIATILPNPPESSRTFRGPSLRIVRVVGAGRAR